MNEVKHYCPKCGEEAISSIKGHMILYKCSNEECSYTYNIDANKDVIDISFKSKGLAKALSNLCPYPFEFDGIKCSSMEAFLQSLKTKEPDVQQDICNKPASFCYKLRPMYNDWRENQTLYWKGTPIDRHSKDYFILLTNAYEALLNQSPLYRYALNILKENGYTLDHSIGCEDVSETILTPNEFMAILDHLIKNCL